MNAALIEAIVALLGKVVPTVAGNAPLIDSIIESLVELVPVLIKSFKDLVPEVQNIIAALKGTDGITPEQNAALDSLEAQADAEFDDAARNEGFGEDPNPA